MDRQKLLNKLRSTRYRWNNKFCELVNSDKNTEAQAIEAKIDHIDELISLCMQGKDTTDIQARYEKIK